MTELVRRRPWHVALGALGAGLALTPAPAGAVAAVGGVIAAVLVREPRLAIAAVVLLMAGTLAGSVRVARIEARASAPAPGSALAGRAVLLERPRPSRFGWSAAARIRGVPVLLRSGWSLRAPRDAGAGSIVAVSGLVREPKRSLGSSLDWPAYLHRRGIWREVALDTLRPVGRRGGLAGFVDSLRRRGERALGSPLLRGMVLGEDESIDETVRDDFRRSGLAHVLAVSGQNVMLLFALAAPLLAAARAAPRVRIAVLFALVAVYVPLAGAGPSLQRAAVMAVAGLAATAAGRPSSRWYALLLAAAATLAINPLAAGDPGWQLSFVAVVGILLLGPLFRSALGGLPRPLAEGAAITLAATVATAPLLAHDFGSFSLAGIGANLAALPLVAPIMWFGMLQVAAAQAGPTLAPLLAGMGHVNQMLASILSGLARRFAEMPGAHVVLPLSSPVATVGAYIAIAAVAFAARAWSRRLEPWRTSGTAEWRRLPFQARTAIAAVSTALAGLGALVATAAPAGPTRPTVSFLDVGQGDATLVQDGAGASVLFDGGPPEARVYRKLRAAGVRQLDLMVSTHQSRDHQGGLHEVLRRIPTRLMLENGRGTRDPDYRGLLAEADARGVHRLAAQAGQVLHVGRLTIELLGPPPRAPGGPPPEDPNETGVAAIVSEGSFDLWLSADAESDAILQYPLRAVEAMKVSHHGSRDDRLPEVLKRLQPQIAAIEVGRNNPYGHPAAETLSELKAAVPHVYRTDRDGTVKLTVESDGSMQVAYEK